MKIIRSTTFAVPLFMVMCITCVVQPVSAGVEAECRQEAEEFGIMPELRNDYINGCIDSRGGVSTSASTEEDYVPPSESDDTINLEAGSENAAE